MEVNEEGGIPLRSRTFTVSVGGSVFEIYLSGNQVDVEGKQYQVDFTPARPGLYSLTLNGETHDVAGPFHTDNSEVASSVGGGIGKTIRLSVDGIEYEARLDDEHSLLIRSLVKQGHAPGGECVVRAPMPGLISRIEVEQGERIDADKGLLVLEAMKMENEIRAQRGGVIKTIHVVKGKAVEKGELLVTISEH